MSQITIVSSSHCSYCHAAKNLLNQQGQDYDEIDLHEQPELAKQLILKSGQRTVPQIFINSTSIGGYSELSELVNQQQFESLLNRSH